MDDHHHTEDNTPQPDEKPVAEKPVDLLPSAALPYSPDVEEPLDLLVDPGMGVIVGRSESFHRKYPHTGLGMIGAVTESCGDILESLLGMPVHVDLVSPHVMLVAGKRGSGKSYTLGIIAEELARTMERREIEVAGVVIDTVDVFRQGVEPNDDQEDLLRKWGLEARGFPVAVYIPHRTYNGLPDEVKKKARLFPLGISPRELTSADWGYVLEKGGQLSTAMDNLMGDILENLRKGYINESGHKVEPKRDFSIRDMISCIESKPLQELYQPATRTAMIQRLKSADRLGVFHPGGTSAQDLAVAGQITVIDVAPLGSDAETVLAILTNMLCRQVLTYRMAWTNEGVSAREELPPTWLIVDEAHTLVPKSGSTPAKEAIVSYAKLGRRFGCSLVLCTQQPSAVADEAISQADIILSHSLSHDSDIRALQQRAPAVMPERFRDKVFISSLPRGVALLFDQSTENKRGFVIQIRPRISQHGGTDRLSAMFEAARLMTPEDLLREEAEPVDEELAELPRPPLKLSKEDWELLDAWMKDYIQTLSDRHLQEFDITEEPSPREEELVPEPGMEWELSVEAPFDAYTPAVIDGTEVIIRRFGPVSESLLGKAITRKVLYSPVTHEFLFGTKNPHRESKALMKHNQEPHLVVEEVVTALVDLGMSVDSVSHGEGFSFVLLRKDGIRAALSGGVSESLTCVSVVVVSDNRKEVAAVSSRLADLNA